MKKLETKRTNDTSAPPSDFIRDIIAEDLRTKDYPEGIVTRFPPEPNGYLHIGHAKAICITYGIAEHFNGRYNLRFDDTNPSKEKTEYVDSIIKDIQWLGFDWEERLFFTSDYFEQLYEYGEKLIENGNAYVCDLSPEETRIYRGTLTEPGKDSPFRNRSVQENLDLFRRMRGGEFENGSMVLRAKIDMTSPNMNMRDPVMYRIMHAAHHRTGDEWCIYPMYDFAHGQSDSIEGITHSLCDTEYEDHRPLYDWFLDRLEIYHPRQIEFARGNLNYTVLSKRKLRQVVEEGHVKGWDDPRMPTLSGMRRRGYTAEAIRNFCDRIGISKRESVVDMALLEHSIREDLNKRAPRVMGVLHPLKVIIDNYPVDQVEYLDALNNPEDPDRGSRKVPFSREIYVERDDFRENPPKKFFRLGPGREVRLRYGYYIQCESFVKDDKTGEVVELHCTYDPETRGGWSKDGRKVRGTLHWVSADHSVPATIRLYDRLFDKPNPLDVEEGLEFTSNINPDSLESLTDARLEPSLADAEPGSRYQFERLGYFCVDTEDSTPERLVFNRTVTLRDSWARIEKKRRQQAPK